MGVGWRRRGGGVRGWGGIEREGGGGGGNKKGRSIQMFSKSRSRSWKRALVCMPCMSTVVPSLNAIAEILSDILLSNYELRIRSNFETLL